jgi:hypothetical protein
MLTCLHLGVQLAKLRQYAVGGTFLAAQKVLVQTHGQKNSKAVF